MSTTQFSVLQVLGRAILALLVVTVGIAPAQAIPDSTDSTLQGRLLSLTAGHAGHVALFARQLTSGRTIALDAKKPVQTASVIKLAILYEAMEQVREGHLHWEDQIDLRTGDAVHGSGLLQFFDTPLTLTVKDVLTMMIVVSDNTATNLAIERLGLEAINTRLGQLGLKNTYLYKKIGKPATSVMPADQPKFGLGKTTAEEMENLIERIGLCEIGPATKPGSGGSITATDAAICEVALTMLRNQFYRETIPRYLENADVTETGVGIASKTGSLDAVRNDVALVSGKNGPIVLSIFTYDNADHGWTVDNTAELLIARLAREIVNTWSPQGLDSRKLVPGLGVVSVEARSNTKASPNESKNDK